MVDFPLMARGQALRIWRLKGGKSMAKEWRRAVQPVSAS
jgi:hypothetical protein